MVLEWDVQQVHLGVMVRSYNSAYMVSLLCGEMTTITLTKCFSSCKFTVMLDGRVAQSLMSKMSRDFLASLFITTWRQQRMFLNTKYIFVPKGQLEFVTFFFLKNE